MAIARHSWHLDLDLIWSGPREGYCQRTCSKRTLDVPFYIAAHTSNLGTLAWRSGYPWIAELVNLFVGVWRIGGLDRRREIWRSTPLYCFFLSCRRCLSQTARRARWTRSAKVGTQILVAMDRTERTREEDGRRVCYGFDGE